MSETTVYWSCGNKESLRAEEPTNVLKEYSGGLNIEDKQHLKCPAFKDTLKNVFGVRSIFSFDLLFDSENQRVKTSLPQSDFDELVLMREGDASFMSVNMFFTFFTEEDGLEMTQKGAFLEDTSFARDTIVMQGKYDISKWYRPIELSFHLRNGVSGFKIEEGQILYYLDFDTDKKINFVRYRTSDKLRELYTLCIRSKENKSKACPMSWYYRLFKQNSMKKRVLEEIKKNIV